MVMKCFVLKCRHTSNKHACKFFRLPSDENVRKEWLQLVRRTEQQISSKSRVCSCHFDNEKSSELPVIYDVPPKYNLRTKPNINEILEATTASLMRKRDGEEPEEEDDYREEYEDTESVVVLVQNKRRKTYTNVLTKTQTQHIDVEPSTTNPPSDAENSFLKKRIHELEFKYGRFSIDHIARQNDLILYYTGFPNIEQYSSFIRCFDNIAIEYSIKGKMDYFCKADQVLVTLMKLIHNLGFVDLSVRFKCSVEAINNIVTTWNRLFHDLCDPGMLKEFGVNNNVIKKMLEYPAIIEAETHEQLIPETCAELFDDDVHYQEL